MIYIDEWKKIKKYNKIEFEKWWKETELKFNWSWDSGSIIFNCYQHFEIWWNPEKFNWAYRKQLEKYCKEFEGVWKRDYVLKSLGDV